MGDITIDVNQHNKSLENLYEIRRIFHKELQEKSIKPFDKLEVEDQSLRLSLFGIEIFSSPRPIVSDGRFSALEYDFCVGEDQTLQKLWRLYVTPTGKTYLDPNFQRAFSDLNDEKIVENIGYFICTTLIESNIFAPSSD